MTRRTYSGREVVKFLSKHGFDPKGREGSHVQLRYEHSETGSVRNVTVPLHGELSTGTLRKIADQAGARDFDSFCKWIDDKS